MTCKNKECVNHGRSIRFNWGCEKYINNVFTNADMIREMTDDELSQFLWQFDLEEAARDDTFRHFITRPKLLEWLQSPVSKENSYE